MKKLLRKFLLWILEIDVELYSWFYIHNFGELIAMGRIPMNYIEKIDNLTQENFNLNLSLKKMNKNIEIINRRIDNIIKYIDNKKIN